MACIAMVACSIADSFENGKLSATL